MANSNSITFEDARSAYLARRAISDGLPVGAAGEDAAVDAYCDAMDHLVVGAPAPDGEALLFKIELARERCAGFSMPDAWLDAFADDVRRLTARA